MGENGQPPQHSYWPVKFRANQTFPELSRQGCQRAGGVPESVLTHAARRRRQPPRQLIFASTITLSQVCSTPSATAIRDSCGASAKLSKWKQRSIWSSLCCLLVPPIA